MPETCEKWLGLENNSVYYARQTHENLPGFQNSREHWKTLSKTVLSQCSFICKHMKWPESSNLTCIRICKYFSKFLTMRLYWIKWISVAQLVVDNRTTCLGDRRLIVWLVVEPATDHMSNSRSPGLVVRLGPLLLTWLNFNLSNGTTLEFWEWIRNFTPHFTGYVITYPCWASSWSMMLERCLGRSKPRNWSFAIWMWTIYY